MKKRIIKLVLVIALTLMAFAILIYGIMNTNKYTSRFVSEYSGTGVSIGDVDLSKLYMGDIGFCNIFIHSPIPPYKNSFYINSLKISFSLIHGNIIINCITIDKIDIFYNKNSNSKHLRKTLYRIQDNLKTKLKSAYKWKINKVVLNQVCIHNNRYGIDESVLMIPRMVFKNSQRKSDKFKKSNISIDSIFDKIDSVYNNPVHLITYPKIFKGQVSSYNVDWALLSTQAYFDRFLQISFMNYSYHTQGMQLGLLNYTKDSKEAQIGIFNFSKSKKGFQLGLLNFSKHGFLPVFPIFNFTVGK